MRAELLQQVKQALRVLALRRKLQLVITLDRAVGIWQAGIGDMSIVLTRSGSGILPLRGNGTNIKQPTVCFTRLVLRASLAGGVSFFYIGVRGGCAVNLLFYSLLFSQGQKELKQERLNRNTMVTFCFFVELAFHEKNMAWRSVNKTDSL